MINQSVETLTEGYFRWHCRRGMKELDFILNRYLDCSFHTMTDEDKLLLHDLLLEQDMLLWYWFSGKSKPSEEQACYQSLIEQICADGYHKE